MHPCFARVLGCIIELTNMFINERPCSEIKQSEAKASVSRLCACIKSMDSSDLLSHDRQR